MADALVAYARHFTNKRTRRMRREKRTRVGEALRIPQRDHDHLDCIESEGLFVVFMPNGGIGRDAFHDLRPLLRQAIVAACAAFETYVADKAMEFVTPALRSDDPPAKLKEIPLTVGSWIDVERNYKRRGWGIKRAIEEQIRRTSSAAPTKVGDVLNAVGVKDWAPKLDSARCVKRGETKKDLRRIATRRNKIAHTGDRVGQGRAHLTAEEVDAELDVIRSVVGAIEAVMANHSI